MTSSTLGVLLSFAENGQPVHNDSLALTVSGMCVDETQPLTPAESVIAYDILQRIYPDAEMHVRRTLAERFAMRPDTPHQLVTMLANDAIDIARPVIMHSPVLKEDDLVRICVDCSRMHRLCVAVRPHLGCKVTDVLVFMGDERIQLALVRNRKADFSHHALKHLVMNSRTVASLQEPLLHREEMTAELASLMYRWVGESLKTFINDSFGIAAGRQLNDEVIQAAKTALAERLKTPSASSRPREPVAPPPEKVQPLLVAVRRDNLAEVERELERLTRLPAESVRKVLYHSYGEALAVVCQSLGISRTLFSEVYARLHGTPPYSRFTTTSQYQQAMTAFDRLSEKLAVHTLAGWLEHPETVWGDASIETAALPRRRQQELEEIRQMVNNDSQQAERTA